MFDETSAEWCSILYAAFVCALYKTHVEHLQQKIRKKKNEGKNYKVLKNNFTGVISN